MKIYCNIIKHPLGGNITSSQKEQRLTFPFFDSILKYIPQYEEFTFHGDEPLLHPQIKQFCRASQKKGAVSLLCYGYSQEIMPHCKHYLMLKYPKNDVQDFWTKRRGSFSNLKKIAHNCRDEKTSAVLRVELDTLNMKYLLLFKKLAEEWGVELYIERYIPHRVEHIQLYIRDDMWKKVYADYMKMGIKVFPNECLKDEVMGISIEGKATLCRHSNREITSMLEDIYPRIVRTVWYQKDEYRKAGECPALIDLKKENLKPLEVVAYERSVLPARV